MLALRRTVAASAPLVGAYSGLRNGKRKIEKQRPGEIFLIFFRFQRDLGRHLGVVISNIQPIKASLDPPLDP
jgi:hypothetical protein